jgi:hypothetical protein
VVLAGEHERPDDGVAVDDLGDLVGVLLDDREQVGQELALELGEVLGRGLQGTRDAAVGGAVDGPVRLDADADRAVGAVGLAGQAAALCVLLARNLSPSSSVCR